MIVFILTTSDSQSPMPFKVYLNSEFYLQSTIINYSIPHLSLQYRGTAKQMTNTNNFVVHKILPIDNATLFLVQVVVMQKCLEFNL